MIVIVPDKPSVFEAYMPLIILVLSALIFFLAKPPPPDHIHCHNSCQKTQHIRVTPSGPEVDEQE